MAKNNDPAVEIPEEFGKEAMAMYDNGERDRYVEKAEQEDREPFTVSTADMDQATFNKKYAVNAKVKQKPELRDENIILSVRHLKQFFFFGKGKNRQKLKAVSNVSFDLREGECLGIVGESGCGKTTTGRSIIRLYDITSGAVYYRGVRITAGERWNKKEIKWTRVRGNDKIKTLQKETADAIAALDQTASDYSEEKNRLQSKCDTEIAGIRQHIAEVTAEQKAKIKQIHYDNEHVSRKLMNEIQMIFQDPIDSLDPRMTVEDIIQEGLQIQGFRNKAENHKKVVEMLRQVGLVEEHASRYPHEFSGGQRQRIGIARALVMNPKLLICDEPISALDVSIRAQIINLLNDLKHELNLSIIFIAHDLSVVKYFCDSIVVMYFGKVVEKASSDELFRHPMHPYTKSLLSAIPKPNPLSERKRKRITYDPNMHNYQEDDMPELRELVPGHFVYCSKAELEQYRKEIGAE